LHSQSSSLSLYGCSDGARRSDTAGDNMQSWQRTWVFMATFVASFCVGTAVKAETINGLYCGGGYSGNNTLALCSQTNNGFGPRMDNNGAAIWLRFTDPVGTIPPGTATLQLPPSNEDCSGGTWSVYVMNKLPTGNDTSNWVQVVIGTTNWQVAGGTGGADRYGPVSSGNSCSSNSATLTLDATAATMLTNGATIGLYPSGMSNQKTWYEGANLVDNMSITWESPEVLCEFCEFMPELSWGNDTSTGNGTATTTWTDRLGFIFQGATNTFPICMAEGWFNIFDAIAGMTTSDIEPQALVLTTNFNHSTSTAYLSTTGTEGTTDLLGFSELVETVQNWFSMVAWSLFGIFIFFDIGRRKGAGGAANGD